MIDTLYDAFKPWSAKGSVYVISDTHFDDPDCKLMDMNWLSPEEHINRIRQENIGRNDTLIHLGDVGNPRHLSTLKCHKVLITGNHDQGKTNFYDYFDEVFDGPLFIAKNILLSHEPIMGLNWCLNIHGHDHTNLTLDKNHLNLASNVVDYRAFNLGKFIKHGGLHHAIGIHRPTIDKAASRKRARRNR